jgi:inner membrane transporter RhtA
VSAPAPKPRGRPAQAVALVMLSIVSIQSGAAVAIGLFDRIGPAGAVFLRNLLAIPFAFAFSKLTVRAQRRRVASGDRLRDRAWGDEPGDLRGA